MDEYLKALLSFRKSQCNLKTLVYEHRLEKVSIGTWCRPGVRYIFSKLARDLPQVKSLSIILSTNWVKYLCKQISWLYPFSKVEQLNLFSIKETKFDIQKMISILRACPLLQKFRLVTKSPVSYEQGAMPVSTECVHKYLKEVEIGRFYGTWNQIEFALYFLEYAPALEQMVIDPHYDIAFGPCGFYGPTKRVPRDEGERQKVCDQLQGHSKSAVVIIS